MEVKAGDLYIYHNVWSVKGTVCYHNVETECREPGKKYVLSYCTTLFQLQRLQNVD